jgi:hypothetical protein
MQRLSPTTMSLVIPLSRLISEIPTYIALKLRMQLRRTLNEVIHFEDTNDCRVVVAVDDNEFKIFIHKSGYKSILDYLKDESEEKLELNWFDPEQWEQETMIKMKSNGVLFYRSWIFNSFQDGILHYYKLKVI